MKKRLLLCFACAVMLFLIVISTDNDFIDHIPLVGVSDTNDISCYEEMTGDGDGLPEFDPESGTVS